MSLKTVPVDNQLTGNVMSCSDTHMFNLKQGSPNLALGHIRTVAMIWELHTYQSTYTQCKQKRWNEFVFYFRKFQSLMSEFRHIVWLFSLCSLAS